MNLVTARLLFSFPALLILFLWGASQKATSQIPQTVQQIDPATQDHLEWLLTGKGRKAADRDGLFQAARSLTPNREEIGDIRTEMEYMNRTYGSPEGWSQKERLNAVQQAKTIAEEFAEPKGRSTFTPPSEWTLRGPVGMQVSCGSTYYSGRVSCLDYSPELGLLVGAAKGGLWKPILFFMVPLTDRLPTQASGAVAGHPVNGDTIFYGTGDYGTQSGGGGTGVYRSTDKGTTWVKMDGITSTPSKVSRILIPQWNTNVVLVAGNTGIWKSTNNGDTWSQRAWWDVSDLRSSPAGGALLAGRPGVGVYRSTDQGDSWHPLTNGLPTTNIGYITLDIAPSSPNVAYVQIAKPTVNGDTIRNGQVNGIFKTTDLFGSNPVWTNVTPTGNFPSSTVPLTAYMYGQGWIHNAIAVHPTNSSLVLIAGGTMLKTTNGGSNWTDVSLPHADVKTIYFRPGDNLLYVGGDGGVYTSTDVGTTWSTSINRVLPTTMFYNVDVSKANDDVVFGASQDNATEGTRPGNRTKWWMSNIADGIDATCDWSNSAVAFTSTQFGDVFRTTTTGGDCGQWPWINSGMSGTAWSTYITQDPTNQLWIYYNSGGQIRYSSNQGTNWGLVNSTPLAATISQIAMGSDGLNIYGYTNMLGQRLIRYQWSGTPSTPSWTFNNISSNSPAEIPVRIVPSSTDPGRAYALFNGGWAQRFNRIYRTTDFGGNWENITGNFSENVPLHDLAESPTNPNLLWLATDLGVYKSTNGGTRWWWWNRGMPDGVVVNDLEYASSAGGDYLLAGTFGRSTYERDVNAPVFSFVNVTLAPHNFALSSGLLLAPSDSGRVGLSTDGGSGWSVLTTPVTTRLNDAVVFDSLIYLVVGDLGKILGTTDQGKNWFGLNSPVGVELRGVGFLDTQIGCAVGDGGTIIRTTDGGNSWSPIGNGFTGSLYAIQFVDQLTGYAAGVDMSNQIPARVLLQTTDAGLSWNPIQNIGGPGTLYDVSFVDTKLGFCAADDGTVIKTTDGGQSWVTLIPGVQFPLFRVVFADAENGWACGAGGTMVRTRDGGATWTAEETDTQDDLLALIYVDGLLLSGGTGGLISRFIQQPANVTYAFNEKWNMVSVPLSVMDSSTSAIFPDATPPAYSFNNQYVPQTSLTPGVGYWLKFAQASSVPIRGYAIPRVTIDVVAGWNMIGGITSSISTLEVQESTPGLIVSSFFEYDQGYNVATTIDPSKGYWVKVSADGQLTLDAESQLLSDTAGYMADTAAMAMIRDLSRFNRLTIRDAQNRQRTLYFSMANEAHGRMRLFELPPVPPEGSPDVRFSTGYYAVNAMPGGDQLIGIHLQGMEYPVRCEWELKQESRGAALQVDGVNGILHEDGAISLSSSKSMLALFLPGVKPKSIPSQFALKSAYPNPFNPQTRIEYDLPVSSTVSLRLYNALGQLVATLRDGVEPAGVHQVIWTAQDQPTGVYFYRLEATAVNDRSARFSGMKKVLLVR